MLLKHYSEKKFEFHVDFKYKKILGTSPKPNGLWLSDESDSDDGWHEWCLDQKTFLDGLKYVSSFKLVETDSVLILEDYFDIRGLIRQYPSKELEDYVDWERVRKKYKGIIISPYNWNARNNCLWYYGWDCSSGCVWDLSCVEFLGTERNNKPKEVRHDR